LSIVLEDDEKPNKGCLLSASSHHVSIGARFFPSECLSGWLRAGLSGTAPSGISTAGLGSMIVDFFSCLLELNQVFLPKAG
jgi:hypothetical protein